MSREQLTISGLRSAKRGGISRVSADVDGSDLWFESAEVVLRGGHDVKLEDYKRAAVIQQHVRAVAREVGAHAVFVRTNVRELPRFRAAPWPHTHGGALAAIGHLLSEGWGKLLISGDSEQPAMTSLTAHSGRATLRSRGALEKSDAASMDGLWHTDD
jgi:hypothetical protein